jgi:hypothetical protein
VRIGVAAQAREVEMQLVVEVILTGLGATLTMDLGAALRQRLSGSPFPNYTLVGRWVGHMKHGQLRHAAIAASPAIHGVLSIGWLTHYATGVAFAALLLAAAGPHWFERPSLIPAIFTGIVTVLAPFLVLQPAMGAGLAARCAPRPGAARLQSFLNHVTFGLGLYLAARLVASFPTGV